VRKSPFGCFIGILFLIVTFVGIVRHTANIESYVDSEWTLKDTFNLITGILLMGSGMVGCLIVAGFLLDKK
jgi:hypothetical protein